MFRNIPNRLWLFILAMALLRGIIASSVALGNDEVYYWTYAQDLQWNYFDHPPFVAWLIRITTANLWLHEELAVRAGAIVCSSLCTLILYQTGSFLQSKRTGWYAALLYSASFYGSIIAGTFILPDSPQMVFWLWSIFLLLRILRSSGQSAAAARLWYWFGLAAGLCMLCKVHGVFLWLAVLLFVLIKRREFLKDRAVYVAVVISLLMISPVIIWNVQHHFITYTYHSGRLSLMQAGINPISFIRELSGELFYNNPVVFFLVWWAVLRPFQQQYSHLKQEVWLLLYCALPLILLLIVFSVFRDTLPHWSGPAYSCLILLAALKMDAQPLKNIRLVIGMAMFIFLFCITAGIMVINFYPGSLSAEKRTVYLGKGDPTLDLYGWKETGNVIDSIYASDRLRDRTETPGTVVITKWFPAGHLDFYVCAGTELQTYGLGAIFDLHQYYWSNQMKRKLLNGRNAYYIVPSNLFDPENLKQVKSRFRTCQEPVVIPVFRNGAVCKNILVYRLEGYKQ